MPRSPTGSDSTARVQRRWRERLIGIAFVALIGCALVLGATDVVSVIDAFGVVGVALAAHAVALLMRIRADLVWVAKFALTVLLGVVLAVAALVRGHPEHGLTGQGTSFTLGEAGGRVRSIETSLTAKCVGGSTWRASWSPIEGAPVHFTMTGRSFWTREVSHTSYSGGTVGRIAFVMHGQLTRSGSAEGTVRLVARFYTGEQETGACDSLDVPWAIGPRAAIRVHQVPVGHVIDHYYPEAPSLAGHIGTAREQFIASVDQTCVRSYNQNMGDEQRNARTLPAGVDSRLTRFYVGWHSRELQALARLGPPPEATALYDGWLANVRERVALEAGALKLYQHGDLNGARRILATVDKLGPKGNGLGQRFGLLLCTSSGDRTPVPVLSDDPARPLP
jgi:hypothetical protein